jgi:hypothetical protein
MLFFSVRKKDSSNKMIFSTLNKTHRSVNFIFIFIAFNNKNRAKNSFPCFHNSTCNNLWHFYEFIISCLFYSFFCASIVGWWSSYNTKYNTRESAMWLLLYCVLSESKKKKALESVLRRVKQTTFYIDSDSLDSSWHARWSREEIIWITAK